MTEPWSALARVVPRATVYAARAARPTPDHPVPALRRSPLTWAQVLIDDAVVTVAHVRGRDEFHDFARLEAEARDAVEALTRVGAFADKSVLFPIPPPITETRLTSRHRYGRSISKCWRAKRSIRNEYRRRSRLSIVAKCAESHLGIFSYAKRACGIFRLLRRFRRLGSGTLRPPTPSCS